MSSAPGSYELLMDEFSLISDYIQEESGFSAEMIIGTSYDEQLEDKIAVTIIATGFESGPKINKIIVGNVDERPSASNAIVPKPIIVDPTANTVQNSFISPNKLTIPPAEVRFSLDDEIVAPKPEEVDPMDLRLFIEDSIEEEELPQEPMMELEFEQNTTETQTTIFDLMQDNSSEEQEKKIEKHIQRIKSLKDLNLSIKTPQGLRDLEKEPAYKRRLKRLDEVPHSSASQVSRLSLFDDNTGRPEIKSNNSFLHDNVD
ncbi:MAG: hypothetical protein FGM41_01110 [Bacteroidetes bacterium]|nr:hypothetical protein [Bacteroidota bacterium]